MDQAALPVTRVALRMFVSEMYPALGKQKPRFDVDIRHNLCHSWTHQLATLDMLENRVCHIYK
ncbi:hypothetical protein BgiMline_015002, partial [Biomphalaria glabrata]